MGRRDPERQREYQRRWVAARRRAYFEDKACATCPSTERLQLHHIDPEEKEHHAIWTWARERFEAEVAKCVVLCADCHRTFHAIDQMRHGRKRYQRGCRCQVCRAAKADDNHRNRRRTASPYAGRSTVEDSTPIKESV